MFKLILVIIGTSLCLFYIIWLHFFLFSFLFFNLTSVCLVIAYLHKVIHNGQRNDDDSEERSGQTDDKQRPQYTQQTHEPGAKGLRNGFVYCKNVL